MGERGCRGTDFHEWIIRKQHEKILVDRDLDNEQRTEMENSESSSCVINF